MINIKTSEIMSQNDGVFSEETTLIRIPKVLREQMGLSLGQDITLNSNKNTPVVLTISPAYKADVDTDSNYCYVSNSIFNLINIVEKCPIKKVDTITLGCDPELFLIDNKTHHLLRANMFFRKSGEVGHDGMLAELRPKPSIDPGTLTDNLYDLIKQTRQILNLNLNNYDPGRITLFGASSYNTGLQQNFGQNNNIFATAGFHLHFGLPSDLLGTTAGAISTMCKIANVLDYYVGIPAILAEQTNDHKRRTNTGVSYGKPSDFRPGNKTFEYRVPGGSLLRHPKLTYGLINLGHFVITDVVSKLKGETNGFEDLSFDSVNKFFSNFYQEIPDLNTMFNVMCSPNTERAQALVGNIRDGLSNMVDFGEREEDISNFFGIIEDSKNINNNIEVNWGEIYEAKYDIRGCSRPSAADSPRSQLLEAKLQPNT